MDRMLEKLHPAPPHLRVGTGLSASTSKLSRPRGSPAQGTYRTSHTCWRE